MILLYLTSEQARHVAEHVTDAVVLDLVCSQLRYDEIVDVPSAPRTVIFRDEGDGLRFAAVAYEDKVAADRAFEVLWEKIVRRERQ